MNEARLGLRENLAQFSLLVLVNAFVGAMVGMERTILPPIAEQEFHLAAKTAVLSFMSCSACEGVHELPRWAPLRSLRPQARARRWWLVAAPVPFLLMWRQHGRGCCSRTRCLASAKASPGQPP